MLNNKGSKNRSNDTLLNYVMLGLVVLLIIFLIFYVIRAFSSFSKQGYPTSVKPTETVTETLKETEKETVKETQKDTTAETATETERETAKETKSETQKESQKETIAETPSETDSESESTKETEPETPNTENKSPVDIERDYSRREADPYAAVVTASQLSGLSEDELVTLIIQGDLGYGAERLEIIQEAGLDYEALHRAVDRRLGN